MKKKNTLKVLAAVALALSFSPSANAQLDALKKLVKGATKTPIVIKNDAPLPWSMEKEDNDPNNGPTRRFVNNMASFPESDVKAFRAKMDKRKAVDEEIVEKYKNRTLDMDFQTQQAYDNCKKEIELYYTFLNRVADHSVRFAFNGEITDKEAKVDYVQCSTELSTVYIRYNENGKYYFYTLSGDRTYLEGKDLDCVKQEWVKYHKIMAFLETKEIKNDDDKEVQRNYQKAWCCVDFIAKAVNDNSPENLEKIAMPKGSSLNGSLSGKALATAKKNYPGATQAVISGEWDVKRDALGNIVRRCCSGWVITPDKLGKRASKVMWCQDYMGGGKYGELRFFGVGTETHYIK